MAGEIAVLTGAAFESGLLSVAEAFRNQTGHEVTVTSNLDENVNQRLLNGELFDVVLSSGDALKMSFLPHGLVEEGGVTIGRAGVGVAIRPNTPIPDISTVDALRRATLAADPILLTTHTSGFYIESMIRGLGIYAEVESRLVRLHNGPDLMDRILAGTNRELGFLSMTLLRMQEQRGLVLVGPLPDELQYFRDYVVVPTTRCRDRELAWEFANFCGGASRACFAANGLV